MRLLHTFTHDPLQTSGLLALLAWGMAWTNWLKSRVADLLFGGTAFTPPGTYYFGLSSTTPANDGTGVTEPSGSGYARVTKTNNKTTFGTSSTAGTVLSAQAITWPTATGNWVGGANLTHVTVHDALSGGNLVDFLPLASPAPVLNGQTPSLASGALSLTIT